MGVWIQPKGWILDPPPSPEWSRYLQIFKGESQMSLTYPLAPVHWEWGQKGSYGTRTNPPRIWELWITTKFAQMKYSNEVTQVKYNESVVPNTTIK